MPEFMAEYMPEHWIIIGALLGTPVGGDDEGDRSAVIGGTSQRPREVRNVCGSEVEVCADDFDYFGEAAIAGFGKLLRRTAHLVDVSVPRATIVTSRWSGEIST